MKLQCKVWRYQPLQLLFTFGSNVVVQNVPVNMAVSCSCHRRVCYSPAFQLTLFHRGILKCCYSAPKQATHVVNTFLDIPPPSSCKECGLLTSTLRQCPPQIIITEIQIWSSRRLLSIGYLLFLKVHRPCDFVHANSTPDS